MDYQLHSPLIFLEFMMPKKNSHLGLFLTNKNGQPISGQDSRPFRIKQTSSE